LTVEVVAAIGSTNTELLARARRALASAPADAAKPALLVAVQQTAGRGRQGKVWQSGTGTAVGASLTFSLALPLAPADWSGLSLAVGLALVDALDPPLPGQPPRLGLKWPNDLILLDEGGRAPHIGRKAGGILISARQSISIFGLWDQPRQVLEWQDVTSRNLFGLIIRHPQTREPLLFRMKCMIFGWRGAPAVFQERIEAALYEYIGAAPHGRVTAYLDDICVATGPNVHDPDKWARALEKVRMEDVSATENPLALMAQWSLEGPTAVFMVHHHLQLLDKVLGAVRAQQMSINLAKTRFFSRTATLLGSVTDGRLIAADPARTLGWDVLAAIPPNITLDWVRRVLATAQAHKETVGPLWTRLSDTLTNFVATYSAEMGRAVGTAARAAVRELIQSVICWRRVGHPLPKRSRRKWS
jgi:hypothetical protein